MQNFHYTIIWFTKEIWSIDYCSVLSKWRISQPRPEVDVCFDNAPSFSVFSKTNFLTAWFLPSVEKFPKYPKYPNSFRPISTSSDLSLCSASFWTTSVRYLDLIFREISEFECSIHRKNQDVQPNQTRQRQGKGQEGRFGGRFRQLGQVPVQVPDSTWRPPSAERSTGFGQIGK